MTSNEPKIAMLSHSTFGSAAGPYVEKVRTATEIVRQKRPDLLVEGEIQFDTAFNKRVAKIKALDSTMEGEANVFVFPDLASGNIAYKIAQEMGGATAIGPIIQGTAKPFMDLSRGCTVGDIVHLAELISR